MDSEISRFWQDKTKFLRHCSSYIVALFLVADCIAAPALDIDRSIDRSSSKQIFTSGIIADEPFRLRTDGRWIKDPAGNTVRLVGASVFWRWHFACEWEGYDPLNSVEENSQKYDVYKDVGANFVRVQLNKWLWDNAHDVYTRAVDTLVGWCKGRNIMVALTFQGWHDCRPDSYRDWTKEEQIDYVVNWSMQAFLMELAERYRDQETVIGFEILLDPIPSDAFWASYRNISITQARLEYRQGLVSAIRAIHDVDENYLVFIYPQNSNQLGLFIKEDPINEPNVIYCLMRSISWDKGYWAYADAYYEGSDQASALMEQAYQSWLFDFLNLGYPAMLMETEVKTDLQNPTKYVDDLFTLFKKYEASICWWSFDRQKTLCEWVFLLQDTVESTPTLSALGQAWARSMN